MSPGSMAQPASPVQSDARDGASVNARMLPALDGVRALSILLVVLAHLGLDHVVPGAFGVTLFFFISGYLITRQLMQGLFARTGISLGGFYLRRALRLMPTALSYVVVSGLLYRLAGGQIGAGAWVAAMGFGANYYDLWQGFNSTLPGVRHPFNILWSLAIEEHFYLFWPLLLGVAWRRRWLLALPIGLCVGEFLWRWFVFDSCFAGHVGTVCAPVPANPVWRYNQLYLSTDTRIDSIGWGVLLAVAEARRASWVDAAARHAAIPALAALVLAGGFLLPGAFARYVLRTTLQGGALLFLMPALLRRESMARRMLSSTPAIVLGRMSYALYLWHWGALGFADWAAPGNRVLWLVLAVGLSAGLTVAAYFGIEQPMLRLRRRAGSHAPLTLTG